MCGPLSGLVEHLALRQLNHLQVRLQVRKLFTGQTCEQPILPVVAAPLERESGVTVPTTVPSQGHNADTTIASVMMQS